MALKLLCQQTLEAQMKNVDEGRETKEAMF